MSSSPTILLDMDSTVYDLFTPWLAWYNFKWDDHLELKNIDRWTLDELVRPECGMSVYDFLSIPGVFTTLRPFPGALQSINKVHRWGIKQVFCSTIVGVSASAEKVQAVYRDFPYLTDSVILCSGGKTLVKGDILVDDGPHNIEAFKDDGGLTILANMHNAPYCISDKADEILFHWRHYPELILELIKKNG